jgi:CRP-like cAMP-binding protein
MNPSADQLRSIPLLAGEPDERLDRIAGWLEIEEHGAGERIVGEGWTGYAFFIIANGMVEVRQDGRAMATLGPGQFFGEEAVITGRRRNADVVAIEPTTVYSMFGTRFRELEIDMPELAEQIRRTAQERNAAGGPGDATA